MWNTEWNNILIKGKKTPINNKIYRKNKTSKSTKREEKDWLTKTKPKTTTNYSICITKEPATVLTTRTIEIVRSRTSHCYTSKALTRQTNGIKREKRFTHVFENELTKIEKERKPPQRVSALCPTTGRSRWANRKKRKCADNNRWWWNYTNKCWQQ